MGDVLNGLLSEIQERAPSREHDIRGRLRGDRACFRSDVVTHKRLPILVSPRRAPILGLRGIPRIHRGRAGGFLSARECPLNGDQQCGVATLTISRPSPPPPTRPISHPPRSPTPPPLRPPPTPCTHS